MPKQIGGNVKSLALNYVFDDFSKNTRPNSDTHYSLCRAAPHRNGTHSYQRSFEFCL